MSDRSKKIAEVIIAAIVYGRESDQVQIAYGRVKELILQHFGDKSDLYKALVHLEEKPDKKSRRLAIEEEIECVWGVLEIVEALEVLQQTVDLPVMDSLLTPREGVAIDNSQIGIVGDHGTIEGGVHYYNEGGEEKLSPDEILGRYRARLSQLHKDLPLRGVDVGVSDPRGDHEQLALERVYVSLDTKTSIELPKEGDEESKYLPDGSDREQARPLSALEAAVNNRCLVILGDPGSGKSTFLNHLTLCLALYDRNAAACRLTDCWPQEYADLLPVPVVLRDFAVWLKNTQEPAAPRHLWEFITTRLKAQLIGFCAVELEKALEKGKAIVLLDGLDEIPDQNRRRFIRDAITVFAERYGASRFIVTCRVLSYQNPKWQLSAQDFPAFELAPFDDRKIDDFITAWYTDLGRIHVVRSVEECNHLAARLQEAIRRPDLWQLAGNPLLLTVMALVNTHKGRLPDARALLYEETVEILLWRWEQVKIGGQNGLPRLQEQLHEVGRADVDLKKILWQIAFDAHGKTKGGNGDSLADISEWELVKAFASLHPDKSTDWAGKLVETMKMRAGLLLEREPGIYFFPHRTFQEYLAGAHLSSMPDFATRTAQWLEQDLFWREAVLLAVGRLVYLVADHAKPLALVAELCPVEKVATETGWRKAWLAGEVLVEMGRSRVEDSRQGMDLAIRVKSRLVELVRSGHLEPKERVRAGNVLSRLGDPRFDPDNWYLPDEEMLGFVKIPAGTFLMGSDKKTDQQAQPRECPQHSVELSEYWIGRYPVTVRQYRAFLEDTGQAVEERWWRLNKFDNHPVVAVRWSDAMQYCEWLSRKMKGRGMQFMLPSEAQWERAARGTTGNIFPWGSEPVDGERANYNRLYRQDGVGTSPVGCFSQGATVEQGLLDMAGNVWEWCLDWYGEEYYANSPKQNPYGPDKGSDRVIRGGSWFTLARYCRAAFRDRRGPGLRFYFLGFRLVLPGQQKTGTSRKGERNGDGG